MAAGGRLGGLGEITVSLLGMEAEKRVFVSAGGLCRPTCAVPLQRGWSGFEALIAPVLPLPAQLWTLPLPPSLGRLGNSPGCC